MATPAASSSTGFVHIRAQFHEESIVTISPEHLKHDDNDLLTQLTTALNENQSLEHRLAYASAARGRHSLVPQALPFRVGTRRTKSMS
jgi:hypothetical protein